MALTFRNIDRRAGIRPYQLRGGFARSSIPLYGHNLYVSSTHAAKADHPRSYDNYDAPFATLAYAVTRVNRAGTVIHVAERHAESISVSDALAFTAYPQVIEGYDLGGPLTKPTFTFDTATAAKIVVDQASIVFKNCRFVVGIDSLAVMFQVTAGGCVFIDCDFVLDDSSLQALIGVELANAAADWCKLLGCTFESINAGANSAVKINAALNNLEIADTKVFGDFGDACIHNPTGMVATNLNIHHNDLTNTQTGDHAIELVSACTGVIGFNIANSTLAAVGTKTAIDPGVCYCIENYGSDGNGDVSGLINPAYDA